jgi:ligand-binding sensor domain-containing protein
VVLSLLASALPWSGASAQAAPSAEVSAPTRREPAWRVLEGWDQQKGLPQNSVAAIRQTKDGYIWVGTRGGLSRFDGVRFTNFDDHDQSQLRENEVFALGEGLDSSLWIGTYGGGASRLKDGRFTVYTTEQGLGSNIVGAFCTDPEGAVWIGTEKGVSRFKDERFVSYGIKEGVGPGLARALWCDSDGAVWIGTSSGRLHRYAKGAIDPAPLADFENDDTIYSLFRDQQGALWIATDEGAYRAKDGRTVRYTKKDGLSSDHVQNFWESQGRLWIATDAGIDRFDEDSAGPPVHHILTAPDFVLEAFHDREGNVWLGYRSRGLARVNQAPFFSYTTMHGLPSDDSVSSIIGDPGGQIFIGTLRGLGVLRQARVAEGDGPPEARPDSLQPSESRIALYEMDERPAWNRVSALGMTRNGSLWVGTRNGMYEVEHAAARVAAGGTPRFLPRRAESLSTTYVRVFYEDSRGALWMGSDNEGLARYQDGRFTAYTTQDGLSHNAVRAIVEDRDGALWIATRGGGLNRLKDGKFTVYREKDGLGHDAIQALHLDRDGVLWMATRKGVSRLQDGRFTNFTTQHGLFSSFVYSIVEDDQDNLWMTCAQGVFRVRRSELNAVAAGKAASVSSMAYGVEHGLSSAVGSAGTSPTGFRAGDGHLWFAMQGGAVRVDPANVVTHQVPPSVHIEEVDLDGRRVSLGGPVEIQRSRGELVFHYTALSFLAPEKNRFRYRLEGYDPDWVDAGSRRVAFYTNIPPGSYTFRVIAGNGDGVWNESGASMSLYLAPRFYQTSWFAGLVVLAVGFLAVTAHHVRVRRMAARERELSQRVAEAVADIKMLRGMLPVCASCKKIRDDRGYWNQMETYIRQHSEAEFSHGICPDCMNKLYPEYAPRAGGGQDPPTE